VLKHGLVLLGDPARDDVVRAQGSQPELGDALGDRVRGARGVGGGEASPAGEALLLLGLGELRLEGLDDLRGGLFLAPDDLGPGRKQRRILLRVLGVERLELALVVLLEGVVARLELLQVLDTGPDLVFFFPPRERERERERERGAGKRSTRRRRSIRFFPSAAVAAKTTLRRKKPYLDRHLFDEPRGKADDGVQLGLDGVDEARVACKRRGVACD
jgi:hypothetical protein